MRDIQHADGVDPNVALARSRTSYYASLQNWTIAGLLVRLGREAGPVPGSNPSAWITDAGEGEIRIAAALCGVFQLDVWRADED